MTEYSLRAGAMVRDITPSGSVALAGYPNVVRKSAGVHDPLLASVLYLDNGVESVLLIALDLLQVTPLTARDWRRAAAAAAGIAESAVFISCSHTHSGPVGADRSPAQLLSPTAEDPPPGFLDSVRTKLTEAAMAAVAKAVPAELAWAVADARGVGCNRHDPAGATDPECGVLCIRTQANHRMLAMAVVYGMHPTVLHEDSLLISSDFPHYTRQSLRKDYGANLVVCYHNGPCGNQSPRHVVAGQTFAEAKRLGGMLGSRIIAAADALPERAYRKDVVLDSVLATVELPRRKLPKPEEAERILDSYRQKFRELQDAGAGRADVRTAECAVFGAEKLFNLARHREAISKRLDSYLPFEIQALKIGDHFLAGVPGELFTEYSLKIKAAVRCAFPVAYVNGETQGYIVTPEAAAAGGYEAAGSVMAAEAGDVLTDAVIKLLAGMS